MEGSIDPRLRDNPWDPLACKGRWRVWNSRRGKPSWPAVYQPHQQAGHMDASDPIRPSKNSCSTGAVHIWVPAFAGTTWSALLYANVRLLAPRHERLVERAFAWRALFDGDDGAALVDVDQRHVEPGAFLQKLYVARSLGLDVGQADQEKRLRAVGDFHRISRQ